MAESSLSVDYQTLVREAARKFGRGQAYSDGTVTVASGIVTLTGGAWPLWSAACALQIEDTVYAVASRTSDSQIVLSNTTITDATPKRYVLVQTMKADRQLGLVEIRDLINEALRDFYSPYIVEVTKVIKQGEGDAAQEITSQRPSTRIWSFLRPRSSFNTAYGDRRHALPDNCGSVTYEWLIYVNNVPMPISSVREGHLESIRRVEYGIPRYCCVSPTPGFDATEGQRYEVVFDCPVTGEYSVEFSYLIVPEALNPTNRFPLGGAYHGQTILAAVMAKIEMALECAAGQSAKEYEQRLVASQYLDQEAEQYDEISYSVEPPPLGTYEWLLQETAAALGENPNYRAWTWTTSSKINSFIQRGLLMFYRSEISPIATHKGHRWSFLRPEFTLRLQAPVNTGTITVVDGVVTITGSTWPNWAKYGADLNIGGVRYRVKAIVSPTVLVLDDDSADAAALTDYTLEQNFIRMNSFIPGFSGLDGPLLYDQNNTRRFQEVSIVDFSTLQRWRQSLGPWSPTQPAMCCILPKSDAMGTYREMTLWPPANAPFTIVGKARVEPDQLLPGQYVLGGPQHYEAILSACVAAANPKRWAEFLTKLAASIEVDQSEYAPQTLGRNSDSSYKSRYDLSHRHWPQGSFFYNGTRYF